jgi:hypothetical protein
MDCLSDELLAELETGTLDEAADTAARAHLGSCPDCRALQRELAASLRSLALVKEDLLETKPKPAVWQSVATRLAAESVPAATILIACVYCKGRLERALYCASCLAPHHSDCWEEHGRCAACGTRLFVRAQSSLHPKRSRAGLLLASAAVVALGSVVAALSLNRAPNRPGGLTVASPPVPPSVPVPRPAPVLDSWRRELRHFSVGAGKKAVIWRAAAEVPAPRVDTPFAVDATTGTLEVVARDGTLRSLDARTGTPVWARSADVGDFGDPIPAPAILAGRAVFTAGCDGTIRAHDAQTGALVWATTLGSPVVVAPRVSLSGKTVAAATADGEVVLLEGDSGLVRARVDVGRVSTAPALTETLVYVAALDELLGIDLATAEIVERFRVGEEITAGPLLQGGRVWVGTRGGNIRGIDLRSSSETAYPSASGTGPVSAIVASPRGIVWVARDEIHALELPGPTGRGVVVCEGPIAGIVAVSERRLAVVLEDGTLEALDLTHGGGWVRAWTYPIAPSVQVAAPPVFLGDELYVCTTAGDVFVFDPGH